MNQTMLLKLVHDLIKDDKPTVDQIKCARTIIDNLIKAGEGNERTVVGASELDSDAEAARKELM